MLTCCGSEGSTVAAIDTTVCRPSGSGCSHQTGGICIIVERKLCDHPASPAVLVCQFLHLRVFYTIHGAIFSQKRARPRRLERRVSATHSWCCSGRCGGHLGTQLGPRRASLSVLAPRARDPYKASPSVATSLVMCWSMLPAHVASTQTARCSRNAKKNAKMCASFLSCTLYPCRGDTSDGLPDVYHVHSATVDLHA